jgi:hypothetical protein
MLSHMECGVYQANMQNMALKYQNAATVVKAMEDAGQLPDDAPAYVWFLGPSRTAWEWPKEMDQASRLRCRVERALTHQLGLADIS